MNAELFLLSWSVQSVFESIGFARSKKKADGEIRSSWLVVFDLIWNEKVRVGRICRARTGFDLFESVVRGLILFVRSVAMRT